MLYTTLRLSAVALLFIASTLNMAQAQERLFPAFGQSGVLRGGLAAIGGTNGGFLIARQDVDGNDATSDSSSEVMNLPEGAEVVYAALLWNQDCILPCTMTGDHAINATRPDGGVATLVLADGVVAEVVSSATKAYGTVAASFTVVGMAAHADVTELVRSQLGGDKTSARFAVGNIHPTITGSFRNATWSIFVAYRDPAAPLRAVAIDFHAAPLPAPDGATQRVLTIGGIQLPSVGPVTGDVIVFAADGQASLSIEERIFIDDTTDDKALSNAANPDNGVWNHSISYRGVSSTTALPNPTDFNSGATGVDLDVFDISGKPTPGATETRLIATTTPAGNGNQEYVLLMTLGLSVDVQQPELVVTKEVTAVRHADGSLDPSGIADHGDLIEYSVTIENTGNDEARTVVLTDVATDGLFFVPGSVTIDGTSDADASPTTGMALDSMPPGATRTLSYTMQVGPAMVGATLENLARVEYRGTTDAGVVFATETPPTFTPLCGNGLPEGEACDDGNPYDVDACRNDCSANPGPEDCDDGFDNDGDGLVDAWDVSDCGPETPTCTVTAPIPAFTVRQAWASTRTFGAMQALVAGDVDGDGLPEIVACGVTSTDYAYNSLVLVSHAGTSDVTFTTLTLGDSEKANAGSAPAIGDVFLSVPGAEIMVMSATGRLHVFSAAGVLLGISPPIHPALPSRILGDGIAPPNLVDIDEDGRPEIVLGNAILQVDDKRTPEADDDALVVVIALDTTIPRGNGPQSEHVVLVDLLSPADCGGDGICQGLEMAAGGTVYALDLGRGVRQVVRRLSDIDATLPVGIDGSTAVADVNGDGSLDIIFGDTRDGAVARDLFIWDPRRMELHARFAGAVKTGACGGASSASTRGMLGVIAVTEVFDERQGPDAQNLPEILFTTVNAVRAYNVNLGRVWELAHSDCSGATGVTAFDFNGDGIREIVINDETRLRIVYGGPDPFPVGVDAARNWAVFSPSGSATLTEHPIIVDIDADGQAEILAVTGTTTTPLNGMLRIFESAGEPWRPTRTTWNQMAYRATAIGEDLRIPTIMQDTLAQIPAGSGNRPLNNANTQSQLPEDLRLPPGVLAAADIEVVASTLLTGDETTGVSACGSESETFAIAIAVRNVGDAPLLAGTPVAIYADDPFSSATPRLLGQDTTTADEVVGAGAEGTITADFPAPSLTTTSYPIFVVINDDGEGPWPLVAGAAPGECSRDSDNMGTVLVACNVCGNGIVELNEICDTGDALGDDACGCQMDCMVQSEGASCENEDPCTTNSTCDGDGGCGGGVSPCPSDETCVETTNSDRFLCASCAVDADCVASEDEAATCYRWGCNELRRCAEVPTPGVSCADEVFCNGAEACDALGACVATPACDGDDRCDEGTATCTDPCGNGVVAGAEACDDGGLVDGDGCSALCGLEHGYCRPGIDGCSDCPDEGPCPAVTPVCGDGRVAAGDSDGDDEVDEVCDDGNEDDDDGCAACQVSCGFECTTAAPSAEQSVEAPQTSGCQTSCGDGVVGGAEGCDDEGTDDNDGCSATCAVETGWVCASPSVAESACGAALVCTFACGNGVLDGAEICDAGEANGTEICGCRADCQYEDPDVGCDDGLACNGGDSCDGEGACTHGGNPCGTKACVEGGAGQDTFTCAACEADAECDDANVCTDDRCVEGVCGNAATTAACDDGTFCNGAGTCGDGVCAEPGNPCDAATEKCDETSRRCIPRCGDGVLDEGETCDGGAGCSPACELGVDPDGLTAQGGGGCGGGAAGDLGMPLGLFGVLAAVRRRRASLG